MNLPNAITLARIAMTPPLAVLAFVDAWEARLAAFVLFLVAAITDHVDGSLARSRGQVTDLGRLLDPLADKLLLIATLLPMYLLAGSGLSWSLASPLHQSLVPGVLGPMVPMTDAFGPAAFPFALPGFRLGLPLWIVVVVLGREVAMTIFRQIAARRGVVIAAIGPAKWKMGLQFTWIGAAYFWFFAATLAAERGWTAGAWTLFAYFNGIVGLVSMIAAVALTLYSLALYVARYGYLLRGASRATTGR